MKRILILLLAAILCVSMLAACTEDPEQTTDTATQTGGTPSGTDSGTKNTDSSSATASSGTPDYSGVTDDALQYDPNTEHKILLGDLTKPGLIVLDLNACADLNWEELKDSDAVVWEWDPQTSKGCELANRIDGIADAKYRWSEYYKKYVVIALNSSGWVGIIDYETKDTLWETLAGSNPHSLELMPNGDLVVIGSGVGDINNGRVFYYPISANNGATGHSSSLKLQSGHGISWDPEMEVLWALGYDGISALTVRNYGTAEAELAVLSGMKYAFSGDKDGHDLSPVYGQPGKYWVTAEKYVWQFDANEETLTKGFPNASAISSAGVKGIAHFKDGTMVMTIAGTPAGKTTHSYSTRNLRIVTLQKTTGKVVSIRPKKSDVTFEDREFYKVHTFCADYQ